MSTPTISVAAYRDTTDEATLQKCLIETADALGYLTHWTPDSRRTHSGHPDVTICGHGLYLKVEMKTAAGRVRPQQRVWLAELHRAGIDARLVRPADLDDVIALLRRMATEDH